MGIGIDEIANSRLLEIAPGLRIAPDGAADNAGVLDAASAAAGPFPTTTPVNPPRPVAPSHVRGLIRELLDDTDADAGLRRALAGERVMQLDLAEWFGARSWVLRPMFRLDAARMLDAGEVLDEAARHAHLPPATDVLRRNAHRLLPPTPPGKSVLWPGAATPGKKPERIDFPRVVSVELLSGSSLGRIIVQHLRGTTERRMAAVSLAARVYRADHGVWPPSIDALVPEYLPEVPADALAPDGARLRYLVLPNALPDGRDRPVVYSAGDNGVYDTKDPPVLPNAPAYNWQRTADEWRDLERWTPAAAPPATAPVPVPAPVKGDGGADVTPGR